MGTLVWIPARGGSERLRGKNLRSVGGVSLVGRAVWAGRDLLTVTGEPGSIVVDTDDERIAGEARRWRAEVPFLREASVAASDTSSAESLARFLERWVPEEDPRWIVVLQPTSPLRSRGHLRDCWTAARSGNWEAVYSVRPAGPVASSLYRRSSLDAAIEAVPSVGGSGLLAPSGACYIISTEAFRRSGSIFVEGATAGVVADDVSVLDVDEAYELELADGWARRDPSRPGVCRVIAEAGVNHNGSLDRAREMVEVAADCGADAVKFQSFDPARLVSPAARMAAYQRENLGLGDGSGATQKEMLEALVLDAAAHRVLREHCDEIGITFMSTPFDDRSAALLVDLGVEELKIGSGEVTNWPLLDYLGGLGLPVILSTGMSTIQEVADAVLVLGAAGVPRLSLMHCVSNYPAVASDANLRAIDTMRGLFELPVGWSDHTEGFAVALAAVARGARIVEKHFTLDRSLPGPDHLASLDPPQLEAMIRSIRTVEASLGDGIKVPVASEREVAEAARRSLHAAAPLTAGDRLGESSVIALRPGTGIPPSALDTVVGRVIRRDVEPGVMLEEAWLD